MIINASKVSFFFAALQQKNIGLQITLIAVYTCIYAYMCVCVYIDRIISRKNDQENMPKISSRVQQPKAGDSSNHLLVTKKALTHSNSWLRNRIRVWHSVKNRINPLYYYNPVLHKIVVTVTRYMIFLILYCKITSPNYKTKNFKTIPSPEHPCSHSTAQSV